MDVHGATGGERAMRRIMALLVALAVLAERVAARSWPVRCFVLWILRRAEGVAAEFVLEATGMPAPAIEGIAAVRNGPEDAMLLAARLRALAAALGALLPAQRHLDGRPAGCGRAFGHIAPRAGRPLGGWAPAPNDTS